MIMPDAERSGSSISERRCVCRVEVNRGVEAIIASHCCNTPSLAKKFVFFVQKFELALHFLFPCPRMYPIWDDDPEVADMFAAAHAADSGHAHIFHFQNGFFGREHVALPSRSSPRTAALRRYRGMISELQTRCQPTVAPNATTDRGGAGGVGGIVFACNGWD